MNPNVKPSHRATVLDVIDPASLAPGTATTGWIAVKDFESFMALIAVGAFTLNGTLDAKLQQATDGAGTGAKDIAGKAITQLTDAGTDDNKQALINLRSEELDVEGGFTHVQLQATTATAAALIFAALLGLDARYQPETHNASVDEVVG